MYLLYFTVLYCVLYTNFSLFRSSWQNWIYLLVSAWGEREKERDLRRERGLPPAQGQDQAEHGLGEHVSIIIMIIDVSSTPCVVTRHYWPWIIHSQDLSFWCGGVTSVYKGLFYTIANINLPLVERKGIYWLSVLFFIFRVWLCQCQLMNCPENNWVITSVLDA